MNKKPHCYGCMETIHQGTICPSCGYDPDSETDNPLYLKPGYSLNNRYLIGKVIGVGGFGIVYIGWDNNLDIKVAVKEFLPKEYSTRSPDHISILPYTGNANDEFTIGIEKFLDEAKALARFQDHPGIVKVNESFRANNTAYMIMQFLDGMTLKEYLKRQPDEKMAFNMAVKAMIPIMDALREVHNAGFVHRDISPDNIFITRQKQIKLLDFGAARYAIGEHSKSLSVILKHGYAPPEQYSTKGNQGPWSDVYAVSATLYRAVTGTVPPDAMERIQGDTIKSPKQLGIDVPLSGELALMRGLALKAADRYISISDLQIALIGNTASGTTTVPPHRRGDDRRATTETVKQASSDNYRNYDDNSSHQRMLGLKIAAGVFVLLIIVVSFSIKTKKETPSKTPVMVVQPAPPQSVPAPEVIPAPPVPVSPPEPVYTPPTPAYSPQPSRSTESDIGDFKYLASNSYGDKFYYSSDSYRMSANRNVQAMTLIVNRYGSVEHKVDVDCDAKIISEDNSRYSHIQSGTIGGAIYENFCNR